jgi:GDP-D-mannose 3',5'-epimerase
VEARGGEDERDGMLDESRRATVRYLISGAGGFIASWLAKRLKADGHWVRGVDIKHPEYEVTAADEFCLMDLRDRNFCRYAIQDMDRVFHLAADMGGIGYIATQHAMITRNNALIDLNMLESARDNAERFLFSSSACVYPRFLQDYPNAPPLKEDCAIPADPEFGYGWGKLFTEQLCTYYREDFGLDTRIVRFHNVYGPLGTYEGGKEKAVAALCRKIALAKDGDEIEVWGDGTRRRSFIYIDDVVEGLVRLMNSDYPHPLNLGTDLTVSVDELANLIAGIAGKDIRLRHDLSKPQGVAGRNSDNTRLKEVLGFEPRVTLVEGLQKTYAWINEQVHK